MMMKVSEHFKWSRSLLARLVPTHRCRPILPLSIGLLLVLHLLVGTNRSIHQPSLSVNKQTNTSADQVMTQIELPPYHRPRSPLDLVAIEIIFGRLFEAFRCTSQAAGTGSSIGGDTQPLKKKRAPMLRSILVPRYPIILYLAVVDRSAY
jgi:hypothetical protein